MRLFQPPSFLLPLALALTLASQADAASLIVEWIPPSSTSLAGFTVFYGTTPGVYTNKVDAGLVTQRVVDGLAEGVTYYLAVQAYGKNGELSDLSEMVQGTTPTNGSTKGRAGRTKPGKGKPSANISDDSYIDIEWVAETSSTISEPMVAADISDPALLTTAGYRVEVGTAPGETSYSAVTREHSLRFDMTDLPAEKYFIRVRPFSEASYRPSTEEVSVSPDRPVSPDARVDSNVAAGHCVAGPNAPRQLGAVAEGAAVSLNWKRGSGQPPAGFVLQVGTMPGLQDVLTAQFAGNVFGVSAMAANAAYALRLSAVNECGTSVWAPETMLYVGVDPLPGMPQALTQTVSGGLVSLTWEPPTTGGPITRYLIEATTPVGPFAYDTGTSAAGFSNANTPPGSYVVTVRAGNATGFGVASAPVVVVVP